MKFYYAVSGRGQGNVFTSYPVRDEHFKLWKGHIEGCVSSLVYLMSANGDIELPPLTWQDEPVAYEITISKDHV